MDTQPAAPTGSTGRPPATANGSGTAPRDEPAAAPPDHPRILVVDPDDDIRLTLVFTLSAEGWEVIEADCMAAANWAVRQHHPTAVLTELMLSGQESTGLLFITALCAYDPDLPVVALTALMVTAERRRRTIAAGARDVLAKPFDRDGLLALLRACHRDYTRALGTASSADCVPAARNAAGPDWVAVGRVIGERRRALGLPKNEAARRARVSNTTWRLLEAGRSSNPTDETIVRVAKVVGVDPDALLGAGRQNQPVPNGDPTAATPPELMEAADQDLTGGDSSNQGKGDEGCE